MTRLAGLVLVLAVLAQFPAASRAQSSGASFKKTVTFLGPLAAADGTPTGGRVGVYVGEGAVKGVPGARSSTSAGRCPRAARSRSPR